MTLFLQALFTKEVRLVELDKLREHEEFDTEHLKKLTEEIASDKILKFAIVVDKNTNIILDGEHRFNALKDLACKKIPVVYVDYNSPDIKVKTWRNGLRLTKKDVIDAGLSKEKFLATTSKHMVRNGDKESHISSIEKKVDVPLEVLRGKLDG